VIRFTLVGQSASEVRRIIQAEGHENDSEPTFPLAKTGAISTSRIRRRRAQDVADTTDAIRAVACIRFVRLLLAWAYHLPRFLKTESSSILARVSVSLCLLLNLVCLLGGAKYSV